MGRQPRGVLLMYYRRWKLQSYRPPINRLMKKVHATERTRFGRYGRRSRPAVRGNARHFAPTLRGRPHSGWEAMPREACRSRRKNCWDYMAGRKTDKKSVGTGTIGSTDRKGWGRAEIVMAAYHTLQYAARRTQTSPVLSKAGLFGIGVSVHPGSTLKKSSAPRNKWRVLIVRALGRAERFRDDANQGDRHSV
jgi:hypothetical protein